MQPHFISSPHADTLPSAHAVSASVGSFVATANEIGNSWVNIALDHVGVGLFVIDPADGSYYWSSEMYRLFGCDPSKGPPSTGEFKQVLHPDDRYIVPDHVSDFVSSTPYFSMDVRTNPEMLPERILNITMKVRRDREGNNPQGFGSVTDVTERKKAETLLWESEFRLRVINRISTAIVNGLSPEQVIDEALNALRDRFSNLRIGYCTIDERGVLTVVRSQREEGAPSMENAQFDTSPAPAFLATLRLSESFVVSDMRKDLRASPISSLFASVDTIAILGAPIRHPLGLVGLLCLGSPVVHKWSSFEIALMADVAASLSMALQKSHEQTERQRAEAEVRFQKTLLQSQQDASLDGVLAVTNDRRVLTFNSRLIEIWKVPTQISVHRDLNRLRAHALTQVVDSAGWLQKMNYLYSHPHVSSRDEFELHDGRIIEQYSAPLFSEEGENYGRVWYCRDVTDQKKAEDQRHENQVRKRLTRGMLAAREEEQKRIARDLHDSVGQCLTSLSFGLQAVKGSTSPQNSRQMIEELQDMLANAVEEVRRLNRNLRSPLLDEMCIASALERLTNDIREVSGIQIEFEVAKNNRRLPSEVETTLFRIAQESFNNIVKHARATNVKMTLRLADRRVDLFIQDNGCGFDTKQAMVDEEGPCWGLLGMKERVELAGGTLLIQSTLRQGTTIGACLPLEKK